MKGPPEGQASAAVLHCYGEDSFGDYRSELAIQRTQIKTIVRATLMVMAPNCASYLRLPLRAICDLELEYRIRIYKKALEDAGYSVFIMWNR